MWKAPQVPSTYLEPSFLSTKVYYGIVQLQWVKHEKLCNKKSGAISEITSKAKIKKNSLFLKKFFLQFAVKISIVDFRL